jgi:hypothetical protein
MDHTRRVAMAWYSAENYPRLRSLMQDANRFPDSYEAWRVSAEQIEREVVRSGVAVTRVYVDPDEFIAWCNERGVTADGAARARFPNEKATL